MARYIDADKLIQALCNTQKTWGSRLGTSWWSHSVKLKDNMVRCIKEQPTADVEEVKHGEWLPVQYIYFGFKRYECSECKDDEYWQKRYIEHKETYCPNCGAKMDGGKAE